MTPITTTTIDNEEITIDLECVTHVIRDAGSGDAIVYFESGAQVSVTMPYSAVVSMWRAAKS